MSVEITIEGLSAKQRFLADIIWSFDDYADVKRFIDSLPPGERKDAQGIVELMKMATMEQLYDGIDEPADAKKLLDRISKR
jgi:hypothetical protein